MVTIYSKLICSSCREAIKEGESITLKGTAPTSGEWREIFFKGVEGLNQHFKVLCEKCGS